MITETGKAKIRDLVSTTYTKMKIGNGGDSTNPLATDLDLPVAETTVSVVTTTQSGLDFKATFTGSDISGQTIKEVGVFDASGNMFARVAFRGVGPFTSSDSVEFILSVEVV